jgi:hypothetical protein
MKHIENARKLQDAISPKAAPLVKEVTRRVLEAERDAKEPALDEAEGSSELPKKTLEAQLLGYWVFDLDESDKLSKQELGYGLFEQMAKDIARGMLDDPVVKSMVESMVDGLSERFEKDLTEEDFLEKLRKDLEKTYDRPVMEPYLRGWTFELREGEAIVYESNSGQVQTSEFALKSPDKAGNPLMMKLPCKFDHPAAEVTIDRDRFILRGDDQVWAFKRISREQFEKRIKAGKFTDAGQDGEGIAPAEGEGDDTEGTGGQVEGSLED